MRGDCLGGACPTCPAVQRGAGRVWAPSARGTQDSGDLGPPSALGLEDPSQAGGDECVHSQLCDMTSVLSVLIGVREPHALCNLLPVSFQISPLEGGCVG